ncbi:MAG: hypothetical protein AB7I48_08885, partial [Planctomycetaceae bacterium]
MSRHHALVMLSILWIGQFGPLRGACAQIPADEERRPTIDAGSSPAESVRTIFKQDADGHWKPVPLVPDAFDENRSAPRQPLPDEPPVPDYFLSKLMLDGTVTETGVKLIADVTIEVVTPGRWFRVPLRFDQALLLDYEHEHAGAGDAAPEPEPQGGEGISWLVTGKGEHRLRLILRVPLRKTPDGEQLQLQLPSLAPFQGELLLRIPSISVTPREGGGVRITGTRIERESTIVSAELTGERMDLRWHVVLQPTETITLEPMDIALQFKEDFLELAAHQEVRFRSGQLNALRVRLPSDAFELSPQGVRISDRSGHDHWVQPVLPADGASSWVTIPLEGVIGNAVELDWRFVYHPAESESEIVIDGFEVAETRRHTGTISVANSPSFRVVRIENGEVGIKRIDVSERSASLAYAFSGGQYRLKLRVEAVTPSLSVTPYYFLLVSPDRVELEAAFQINVDDGSFQEVPIRWPEQDGTSWAVVNSSSLTAGELRAAPADGTADDESARRWTLQLPEAVDRQTIVGLSAAYFFGFDGSQDTTSFSLPTVVGARMFPGWVVISTADNVEVATRAQAGTTLVRQDGSALSARPVTLPEWAGTQPQTVYRLTTQNAQSAPGLETIVTVRPRQTTTSAFIELSTQDRTVSVSQRIAYSVEYGRISRVRLQIPPRLGELIPADFRKESLQFSLNGDVPLEAEWSGRNVSLDLPAPRLGDFEIIVEGYRIERTPVSGEEPVHVPIIKSLDQVYGAVRLMVPDQAGMAITVSDVPWTKLSTFLDGPQWITDQPVEGVSLFLNRSISSSPLRLTIAAALLQTEVDEVGNLSATATYLTKGAVREVLVQLPDGAENPHFEWNGAGLAQKDVVEEPGLPNQYHVKLPEESTASDSSGFRLTLRYRQPPGEWGWPRSRTVDFPIFPEGVWIEQAWWELTLPPSQHLFVPPRTMTPQFQWKREGIFWSRRSNAGFEDVKNLLVQDLVTKPPAPIGAG